MAQRRGAAVPKVGERALTPEERRELEEGIALGAAFLAMDAGSADFDAVAKAVQEAIRKFGRGKEAQSGKSLDDLALALGSVWGEALRRKAGWEWACAVVGQDEAFAIFSPKREFVILPVAVMFNQLEMHSASSMLIYNMVAAGKLPPSAANARVPLM